MSAVRLAAWMPASFATVNTSPLIKFPARMSLSVFGRVWTSARAIAIRSVSGLLPTSIMCALPCSSRCVSDLLLLIFRLASMAICLNCLCAWDAA